MHVDGTGLGFFRIQAPHAGEKLIPLDHPSGVGRQVAQEFAFPFGQYVNLSSEAFRLAWEAGYEGVCSAYGGYNFPGDDPFHLQRIHVDDDMIRLKNRATVDPRKIGTPRFVYGMARKGNAGVGSGR